MEQVTSKRPTCAQQDGGASGASGVAPAVQMEDFSFRYPDSQTGIGPLRWHVEQGAFQLLVGATGSGKTTLLKCLKPAIAPEGARSGVVRVLGRAVDALDARESASLVGYVAQSPENQIVCDAVWHELAFGLENLGMDQDEMRRRVAEVAHFFGIEPWFRRQVNELSGGQKQMVTLAGVLAMRPRVLLLDEPTAQLDPVAEKNFLHALFRVNRELGITVVVATHAPESVAAYATGAVELADGVLRDVLLDRFASRSLSVAEAAAARQRPGAPEAEGSSKPPSAFRPAVVLRDVHLRYARDADWVLRGCDLDVGKGSIHAVVGGNGCGKSTLLRVVAGVAKPERGRVENDLAARQALLPQNPKSLFVCDTVLEELREWQAGCGYADADVDRALDSFGLRDRASNHPYDLSGGQQQALALAKVLLTDPDLLLLDEPTKGLDAASKVLAARALLACAREGVTVLMATHDLAFAALVCDCVSMVFDGQAVCTQPAAAFFADNLFYRPAHDAFANLWLGDEGA